MKINIGQILGCCWGICLSLGLTISLEASGWPCALIGLGLGGLGSMIGSIWNEIVRCGER